MTMWSNWAGTVQAEVTVAAPASVGALQEIVARRGGARGAGQADRRRTLVHADRRDRRHPAAPGPAQRHRPRRPVHRSGHGARRHPGCTLSTRRCRQLGLSLTNLGDIDVQTIAGAISTGTHGTGARFGGLATQVRALELVCADGSLITCSADENPDLFAAARVGLGALGVIATATLQCEPAFALAAAESPAGLDEVLDELDALVIGNDHFEFYWFPHTRRVLTKRNNRVLAGTPLQPLGRVRGWVDDEFLSNAVFDRLNRVTSRRPGLIPRTNAIASRMLSARGFVDRSYRVFASPRTVRFREMEYAVPRAAVPEVLAGIEAYLARSGEQIGFPVEVRFAAADDIWLSTAYERDTGYLAVHQYHRRAHDAYFRAVEDIAMRVGGRPHWGKLHYRNAASLREVYPRFDDFCAVRDKLDPNRVFGNDYLAAVLGA